VCLEEWSFPEEIGAPAPFTRDFGSGYPGDERTKQWLNGHLDPVFGFPSIVRFSWSTCSRLLDESAVNVDWYVIFS
jgi:ribonuclease H2 subunit A